MSGGNPYAKNQFYGDQAIFGCKKNDYVYYLQIYSRGQVYFSPGTDRKPINTFQGCIPGIQHPDVLTWNLRAILYLLLALFAINSVTKENHHCACIRDADKWDLNKSKTRNPCSSRSRHYFSQVLGVPSTVPMTS